MCRCTVCCELPPTLPNKTCNACPNAKNFAVLGNVMLWKIFSRWICFWMPPIKSSCYILLHAVLVVFPPLTLLNLRDLFSVARTLDCHWQGWCKKESPNERVVLPYPLVQIQIQHQSKAAGNYLYLQQSRNNSFSTVCRFISTNFYSITRIFNMSVSTWVHFSMSTMPHTVTSSIKTVNGTNNQWENTCHASGKLLSILIFLFSLVSCAFMKHVRSPSYSVSQTRWGARKETFPSLFNILFVFIQNEDLCNFLKEKMIFSEEILFFTSITVQGLG